MACDIEPTIVQSNKYLKDIMEVLEQTSIWVTEKNVNKQLIMFVSTLIAGRKGHQILRMYLKQILVILFCNYKKDQSLLDKVAVSLVILMVHAEAQSFEDEFDFTMDIALQ